MFLRYLLIGLSPVDQRRIYGAFHQRGVTSVVYHRACRTLRRRRVKGFVSARSILCRCHVMGDVRMVTGLVHHVRLRYV